MSERGDRVMGWWLGGRRWRQGGERKMGERAGRMEERARREEKGMKMKTGGWIKAFSLFHDFFFSFLKEEGGEKERESLD